MGTNYETRAEIARKGFEALGPSPSQNLSLMVQCPHSHHLAAVYDTEVGRVFHSVTHAGSHGRKDRPDVPHHASGKAAQLGRDWFELLGAKPDASVSDDLQAGCECGPRVLSRADLQQLIADGQTRIIIE